MEKDSVNVKKCGFPLFIEKNRFLSASFTIEAAVAVPLLFISIVFLINMCIKMHDIAVSNSVANEAAELSSHLPDSMDISEIECYGNTRLGMMFSGERHELRLIDGGSDKTAAIDAVGGSRSYEERNFEPEKLMRQITILEEVMNSE